MCLTLLNKNKYTAKKNILVYKMLEELNVCKPLKNIKETPYQYVTVKFKRGRTTQESCLVAENNQHVRTGIHAFTYKGKSDETVRYLDHFLNWGLKTYYAVIPKGSSYYLGTQNDVATNKLITFLTKEDFEKSSYAKDYETIVE